MDAVRDVLARAALVFALALPVYFGAAALATHLDLIDWRLGYTLLSQQVGPLLLAGAAALAVLALALAFSIAPRRGRRIAALALLIAAGGIGVRAATAPRLVSPVSDISTDLFEPPAFSGEALAVRSGQEADAEQGRAQRLYFPDIQPIVAGVPGARAYQIALETARALNWRIVAENAAEGRFQARVDSFWYGFTDDIAVRVRDNPPGAIVDVRDAPREPARADDGPARRVRAFIGAMKTRLAGER